MKKMCVFFSLVLLMAAKSAFAHATSLPNPPDSVLVFAYSTETNGGRNGLHFAFSSDEKNWTSIGPEFRFLFSDYGQWGKEKRLVSPFLVQAENGIWHCVWSLNEYDGTFAHAQSTDLINWKPQSYPIVMPGNNCLLPEISFGNSEFRISWISTKNGKTASFYTRTTDFKTYEKATEMPLQNRLNSRKTVSISGKAETGTVHKVAWSTVESLINKHKLDAFRNQQWAETTKSDAVRFAALKPLEANLTLIPSESKKISDLLIGVFFEDINYAADGGLYAELIQNRGFEYALSDKDGRDKSWNSSKAWQLTGEKTTFSIDSVSPIHPNNPHYALLKIEKPGAVLVNEGWDGIALKAGERYDFSVFVRNPDRISKKLIIRLTGKNGENCGETSIYANSSKWKKIEAVLVATQTVSDAQLEIITQTSGTVALDMISLFPQKTFRNHKNGLRADLAQTIAEIQPKFIRFPGGCVAHGDGIGNIYQWKNTIGPLETRKAQRNLWGYHQTAGLGYFEYFRFCSDIGAEPLPVIAAGVPCQNSHTGGAGQQCGIPLHEMDEYIQDILDLIEWANGDKKTKWGKLRAEAGHPEPFNLKYIGIGNEDLITDIFEERFTLIFNAIKEKHPEISVIGTAGPFFEGSDYTEGWKIATKLGVPMVDEHYYVSPGWMIHNQDYYDHYDRSKPKVYLGEYAAHLPGRPTNLETALAEALYLTAVERNADIVHMTSYAPLLAKENHTQWNPDLVYFNNTEVKPTVDYFVQKLFGENSGDRYISSNLVLSDQSDAVKKRVGVSVVHDSKSNDLILKMVNFLPVDVTTSVKLSQFGNFSSTASCTVLSGSPESTTAQPQNTTIQAGNEFEHKLPAYSFTTIRLKTKGN